MKRSETALLAGLVKRLGAAYPGLLLEAYEEFLDEYGDDTRSSALRPGRLVRNER